MTIIIKATTAALKEVTHSGLFLYPKVDIFFIHKSLGASGALGSLEITIGPGGTNKPIRGGQGPSLPPQLICLSDERDDAFAVVKVLINGKGSSSRVRAAGPSLASLLLARLIVCCLFRGGSLRTCEPQHNKPNQ